MSNDREVNDAKSDPISRTDIPCTLAWIVIGILFAVAVAGLLTLILAWLMPDQETL